MVRILFYILNFLFITLVGWLMARLLESLFGKTVGSARSRPVSHGTRPQVVQGETARDPVCGTFVSKEVSHRLRQGDHTLHFCSQECLERYQKNPPTLG